MATTETAPSGRTRLGRKARPAFVAAALAATLAAGVSLAPVGASIGNSRSQPATTNAAAVGLPVNAYQAGGWNVGVSSLPPVSGTVGATQNGPWTVGATQNGPWTVDVGSLPPVELAGTPTVNVANLPAPAPPPRWQGTPYIRTFYGSRDVPCWPANPPDGMVLFVERAVRLSQRLGDHSLARLTMTTGDYSDTVFIPSFPGPTDLGTITYAGALDIGLPVTALEVCTAGGSDQVTVIGFLLPAPAPTE